MAGSEEKDGFDGWAILELMGHRRLGGRVRTVELAGAPLFRIDVPAADDAEGYVTQFYAPSALYCLTPTTEETARAVARRERPTPVHLYELQLERRSSVGLSTVDDEVERDDDEDGI